MRGDECPESATCTLTGSGPLAALPLWISGASAAKGIRFGMYPEKHGGAGSAPCARSGMTSRAFG